MDKNKEQAARIYDACLWIHSPKASPVTFQLMNDVNEIQDLLQQHYAELPLPEAIRLATTAWVANLLSQQPRL